MDIFGSIILIDKLQSEFNIKNIKVNMLTNIQNKNSFTTFTSESRLVCLCGNYDKEALRGKLEQILDSLQFEISKKQMEVQNLKISFLQNIREKQQIIERLAAANSKLVLQNQMLSNKLKRQTLQRQSKLKSIQLKCNLKVKQLNSVIGYLQEKNEQLKRQIVKTLQVREQKLKRSSSPTFQLGRPYRLQTYKNHLRSNSRKSDALSARSNQMGREKRGNSKNIALKQELETHTLNYRQYLNSFEGQDSLNKNLEISRTKSSVSSNKRHSCNN